MLRKIVSISLLFLLTLGALGGSPAGADDALPLDNPPPASGICFTHTEVKRSACCDALDLTPDEVVLCAQIQSPDGWIELGPGADEGKSRPCYPGQRCNRVRHTDQDSGIAECYQTWTEAEASCQNDLGRTVHAKTLYTYPKSSSTTGSIHAFTITDTPQYAMFKVYRNSAPMGGGLCSGEEEGNRATRGIGGTFTNDYSGCGGSPVRGGWGVGMAYREK